MAYRDDVETRRAHVRRLESQLEELEREEALVRSLPGSQHGVLAKISGGPRVLETRFVVHDPAEEFGALADDVFGIDGRIDEEDGALVWRGEPDPRPRRVEVRAEAQNDGTTRVTVRDKVSYRAYLVALTIVLATSGQLFDGGEWSPFGAVVMLGILIWALIVVRKGVLAQTRRRARQALALEEALNERETATRETATRARVQVETDEEMQNEVLEGANSKKAVLG